MVKASMSPVGVAWIPHPASALDSRFLFMQTGKQWLNSWFSVTHVGDLNSAPGCCLPPGPVHPFIWAFMGREPTHRCTLLLKGKIFKCFKRPLWVGSFISKLISLFCTCNSLRVSLLLYANVVQTLWKYLCTALFSSLADFYSSFTTPPLVWVTSPCFLFPQHLYSHCASIDFIEL